MLDRRQFFVGPGDAGHDRICQEGDRIFSKRGTTGKFCRRRSRLRKRNAVLVYSQDWVEPPYGKWRVSLGPNQPVAPPPPSWREYLRSRGDRLDTEEDIERVCSRNGLTLEELDNAVNGFGWEDIWDNFTGPQAKAYHLLKEIDLGGANSKLTQAGQIIFEGCGARPWFLLHFG